LYDFLNILGEEQNPEVKDSILNIYFNSPDYLDNRHAVGKQTHELVLDLRREILELKYRNDAMRRDLLKSSDSIFFAKKKFLSSSYYVLHKRTLSSLDVGHSAVGPSVTATIMKELGKSSLSFWGFFIGYQNNFEETSPTIFGIKRMRQFC